MKLLTGLALLSMLGVYGCASTPAPNTKTPKTPVAATKAAPGKAALPQAAPMKTYCKAVKTNDEALFKTAWSKRMSKKHEADGWAKKLAYYRNLGNAASAAAKNKDGSPLSDEQKAKLAQLFKDPPCEKLAYSYEGGKDAGKGKATLDGKVLVEVALILEDGAWKIDEN